MLRFRFRPADRFSESHNGTRHGAYGTIDIMNRTTVYLPDDLRNAIKKEASRRAVSEAEIIRLAVRQLTGETKRPRRSGIFRGGEQIAEHVDDYLVGFGE